MTERRKPQPYILARTFQEAHSFARETLGLEHGRYRVCTSAGTIKSIRNCDLILAPGWERRHDGFTMRSAIRWTHMNVRDWAKEQAEAPVADGPTERDLTVAYRYNALRDLPSEPAGEPDGLEPAGEQITIEDADGMLTAMGRPDPEIKALVAEPTPTEQAEAPAARRRSRCKSCGTLHFRDEDCPETPLPGA